MIIKPSDLKKIHTKVLLNALRSARANEDNQEKIVNNIISIRGYTIGFYQRGCDRVKLHKRPDEDIIIDIDHSGGKVSVAELKAELAMREHVPNKIEAKKIRQDKAHAKRNR
jgi:hypothetical protein